jgi:hypothetical protein
VAGFSVFRLLIAGSRCGLGALKVSEVRAFAHPPAADLFEPRQLASREEMPSPRLGFTYEAGDFAYAGQRVGGRRFSYSIHANTPGTALVPASGALRGMAS